MSAKNDPEYVLDKFNSVIGPLVNAKIVEIEAEKDALGVSLTGGLAQIDASAHYLQTFNDRMFQQKQALFIGIEEALAESLGPRTALELKIRCEIIFTHGLNKADDTWRRVSRYNRVIRELVEENFQSIIRSNQFTIKEMRPIRFDSPLKDGNEILVSGILVTTTLP